MELVAHIESWYIGDDWKQSDGNGESGAPQSASRFWEAAEEREREVLTVNRSNCTTSSAYADSVDL